jgi:hypothetical protein
MKSVWLDELSIHLANAVGKLQQLIVGDSQAMQVGVQHT